MRKPRILADGGCYHVSARANHREGHLEPAASRELFLSVVARAKKKFRFQLNNLVIMGNHFHFLIRTEPGTSLSEVMKWILGVFAMAWNRRHQNWGHFWGDRFHSRLISCMAEFWRVFRYIDENPVRAAFVQAVEDWVWGRFGIARPLIDPHPDENNANGGQTS